MSVVIIIFWKGFARPQRWIMIQQHSRFYCIRSVSTILIPQPIPHPTEIIKIVGVRCTSPDNTLFTPFSYNTLKQKRYARMD